MVSGQRLVVKPHMRYLGLDLDSRWNFRKHFQRLAPRLMAAAGALSRLLPNIGGPGGSARRLYLGVVRSMALYGAPIWNRALSRQNVACLNRPHRAMAIRIIRGYRTISTEAACVMAGSPPWDLEANACASVYEWRAERRRQGAEPSRLEVALRKYHIRRVLQREWEQRLADPSAGRRTVEAIRPLLKKWMDRRRRPLTFRMTQILSGHGCFGRYLCHVARREPTEECHACGADQDTAEHTLEECPAYADERRILSAIVGTDLSLPAVVRRMVSSERSWEAMLAFCDAVMSQKEAAERERESATFAPSIRRRRVRRRRRGAPSSAPPPSPLGPG